MPNALELITAVLLLLGSTLMLLTGIGLVRFPDTFCRMHASGKAGTLGVVSIVLAAIIYFLGTPHDVWVRGLLAIIFQFLTTPASTHLLAQAVYLCDYNLSERTSVDELRKFLPSRPDQVFNQE
jgi:multicomponent Na+:H+ antiporter subunit G